jgi:hypothetical protein
MASDTISPLRGIYSAGSLSPETHALRQVAVGESSAPEQDPSTDAQSKPSGELRCQHVVVIARTSGFLLKTILQLQLSMRRKTVDSSNVDPR